MAIDHTQLHPFADIVLKLHFLPVASIAVHGPVRPQNASLRLYGGAAFERCLDEFQEAAHVVQFPNGNFPVQWGMHLEHMHPPTC